MRNFIVLILLSVLMTAGSPAHGGHRQEADEAKCKQTKQKIRRIQSRMRQGYNAKQGEKMQERLRELRHDRARICR